MSQCWAYNHSMQRCEKHANHVLAVDDEAMRLHGFTVSWSEDECWTPEQAASVGVFTTGPVAFTPTPTPIPIFEIPADGPCDSCGCPEAAHEYQDDDGTVIFSCERHDCREYIP